MVEFLSENWQWVLLGAVVATNVVNAVLKHYGDDSPGLSKALRLVLDLLSAVTNSNSPGTIKPPGVKSKPPQA